MPYLRGPKKVDCAPIINNTVISTATSCSMKPTAARLMITISATLIRRMSMAFSYLSAIWPAVAENRKNGSMNIPPAMMTSTLLLMDVRSASVKAMKITSAFL